VGVYRTAIPADVVTGDDGIARCWWCVGDPLYRRYHDREWGRPVADEQRLFEKLCLEAFQAGLSWLTILRKRDSFRRAFKSFDIQAVARLNTKSIERLMADPSIVRNRSKILAVITNARHCRELTDEAGSLAAYVWSFEPTERSRPGSLDRTTLLQLTTSAEATALSKDLKRRGWVFVGPTIIYAFMQAMGLVNDHLSGCHVREMVEGERSSFRRPTPNASWLASAGTGPGPPDRSARRSSMARPGRSVQRPG
jgi:DNA-3-methyladenine glycosylase I